MLLRYALRELRNSPRFCLLFCLNLTLGLTGFIALDALKRSFSDRLEASAKNILSADLSIAARRSLSPEENDKIAKALPPGTKQQQVLTVYSMVSAAHRSGLVELKGVEPGFPFYGELTLENQGISNGSKPLKIMQEPKVWIVPELLIQLGIKVGDSLRIGKLDFVVDDVLLDDSSSSAIGAAMAPRIYIGLDSLKASGLLQFGSTAWHSTLFALPPSSSVDQLETILNKLMSDPAIKITAFNKAGQDSGRMLAYLADYLGLVSLVALALASIGMAYLFGRYLDRKQTALATLVSVGLTHERAMLLYFWQLVILGAVSALSSILLSLGILPLCKLLLSQYTPIKLEVGLGAPTLLLALVLGTFGSVLICLPLLLKIRRLNPALLFQEFASSSSLLSTRAWLHALPSLLAFYGLSIWQAHSIQVGSIFCATLLFLALTFAGAGWVLLQLLAKRRRKGTLSSRLAISHLCSNPGHSLSAFIALGLGAALINLIPQIQYSIANELQRPDGDALPSLFLFDVQDDQIEDLSSLIEKQNIKVKAIAPMIMARLSAINDQPFERSEKETATREAEQEERSRNRGVNLSYRLTLAQSEAITAGNFFSREYAPTLAMEAEISLEERYAERLKIKLGDRLTFDVQGLPITGKVTSFRSVKWNTFEPNFFILLQPGLLDDAPKTFLVTLPDLDFTTKNTIQKTIVDLYPNVSMIDVSKLVSKLSELINQMSMVLIVMSWLTVLTGHAVIFSIAQSQASSRRWDNNLLKILGADFKVILNSTLKEFGILGAGSALIGSVFGLIASYVIAKILFKGIWHPSLLVPALMSVALTSVCLLTSYFATKRILAENPQLAIGD